MKPIDWEVDLTMSDQTTETMSVDQTDVLLIQGTSLQVIALTCFVIGAAVVFWAIRFGLPKLFALSIVACLALLPPILWWQGTKMHEKLPAGFRAQLDREGYWRNTRGISNVMMNLAHRGIVVAIITMLLRILVPADPYLHLLSSLLTEVALAQAIVFSFLGTFFMPKPTDQR